MTDKPSLPIAGDGPLITRTLPYAPGGDFGLMPSDSRENALNPVRRLSSRMKQQDRE